MPYPTNEANVAAAERDLAVRLPNQYRQLARISCSRCAAARDRPRSSGAAMGCEDLRCSAVPLRFDD
jgi:hypothetical protein